MNQYNIIQHGSNIKVVWNYNFPQNNFSLSGRSFSESLLLVVQQNGAYVLYTRLIFITAY